MSNQRDGACYDSNSFLTFAVGKFNETIQEAIAKRASERKLSGCGTRTS